MCEIVDSSILEDVDPVSDGSRDDSPFQVDAEQYREFKEALEEVEPAVEAVSEPVDEDWGALTQATLSKKCKRKKGSLAR